MNNKMLRWYLRKVRKKLIFAGKEKKRFLHDLKENVTLYLEEHPNARKGDLVERFGSPQELPEAFYRDAELDEKVLLQKRRFLRAILVVIAVLALVLTIFGVTFLIDTYQFNHGQYGHDSTQNGTFDALVDSPADVEVY